MATYVEVGMGVKRKRGYGQGFPFDEGDTYLGIDYKHSIGATGCAAGDCVRPVSLSMRALNHLAKSNPINHVIRSNAQELKDYAEARKLHLALIYAKWHQLPLVDDSVDGLLLCNIMGDPSIAAEYKTKVLAEASRVVKPGQVVVAKETIAPFTAHEYFAEHDQWNAVTIDRDSPRWCLESYLYDTQYRGVIFEIGVPAVQAAVQPPLVEIMMGEKVNS